MKPSPCRCSSTTKLAATTHTPHFRSGPLSRHWYVCSRAMFIYNLILPSQPNSDCAHCFSNVKPSTAPRCLPPSLLLNNDLCTSLDTGAVADVEINEGLSSAAKTKNQMWPTNRAVQGCSSDSLQHTGKMVEMSGGSTPFGHYQETST